MLLKLHNTMIKISRQDYFCYYISHCTCKNGKEIVTKKPITKHKVRTNKNLISNSNKRITKTNYLVLFFNSFSFT